MTTTTDNHRQTKAPQTAAETLKPDNHGLNHKNLLATHRKNRAPQFSWANASRIKEEYQLPSSVLDSFHSIYGLPRLVSSNNQQSVYSLPALEVILETVPELHDCNAGDTIKQRLAELKREAESIARREMVEEFKTRLQTA